MPINYRAAGVDIGAGNRAVELMRQAVQSTYGPAVLRGIGAFGGLFDAAALTSMRQPVLVASTDGVGTKTALAARLGRFDTVGRDLVNHCVDDILVQGGRPLFFLDYIAASAIDPAQVASVVGGVAAACRDVGCALLGGETAEMPGVYQPGAFDLAGTIVGAVEREQIIDGSAIVDGDAVIGLASSGLHTNGFSLVRRLFADWDLARVDQTIGRPLGDALLEPHRCYLPHFDRLRAAGVAIHGMAHITGGGLVENPPRMLPAGAAIALRLGSWPLPPLFQLIQRVGALDDGEMRRVFNVGIGLLVALPAAHVPLALQALGDGAWLVGSIRPRGSGPAVCFE